MLRHLRELAEPAPHAGGGSRLVLLVLLSRMQSQGYDRAIARPYGSGTGAPGGVGRPDWRLRPYLGTASARKRAGSNCAFVFNTSGRGACFALNRTAAMLKITPHDSPEEFRLNLEGRLSGAWVCELRRCWQAAAAAVAGKRIVVDLREVDFVDSSGQALLAELHAAGARFRAATPVIQAVVRGIIHTPRCGTVEDKASRPADVPVLPNTSGHDPRAL